MLQKSSKDKRKRAEKTKFNLKGVPTTNDVASYKSHRIMMEAMLAKADEIQKQAARTEVIMEDEPEAPATTITAPPQ